MGETSELTDDDRKLIAEAGRTRRVFGWCLLAVAAALAAGAVCWGAWLSAQWDALSLTLDEIVEIEIPEKTAWKRLKAAGVLEESLILQREAEETGYLQGKMMGLLLCGAGVTLVLNFSGVFGTAVHMLGWGPLARRDRLIRKLAARLGPEDSADG